MGSTFADLNEGRNLLLHRWSVWQEAVRHLSQFMDTDVEPTKLGITTRGEGMTVPQEVIAEVVEQVQSFIDSTMLEINDVEQTIMLEGRNVHTKPTRRKEEAQGSKKSKAKSFSKAKGRIKADEGKPG